MSKKQELVQLHQLVANMSYFLDEYDNVSFDRDDLPRYDDIPINSLNVGSPIEDHRDAIFALVKDIRDKLTTDAERKQASISNWVDTPAQQAKAYDVDESSATETTVTHQAPNNKVTESYPITRPNGIDPTVKRVPVKDTVEKTRVRGNQDRDTADSSTQTVETLALYLDDFDDTDTSQPEYETSTQHDTDTEPAYEQATITT